MNAAFASVASVQPSRSATKASGQPPHSRRRARRPEFLFSRNRLNVAISRARCLSYLVCTEELVNTRASSVQAMRLVSRLCSFVEYCP